MWQSGSLEVCGSVKVWKCDSVEEIWKSWQSGSLAVWKSGSLEVWKSASEELNNNLTITN